ncbi:MAG: hypothetical protein HC889_06055 [Synechococcaceae cyanobacterium SM1_2_3]|nr:hypothetical protein [Synechococcaceae cyanobacterium SM1_2_3]
MDTQLNIRCTEETATTIKALAESAGLKLGALLEKLIARYQPDSELIPADSNALADLRAMVADLESRLTALESRPNCNPMTDSGLIAKDSTGEFNQDLAAFKSAVVTYWQGGMTGYGPIATALNNSGYRTSNNTPYTRDAIKKVLQKAGLV